MLTSIRLFVIFFWGIIASAVPSALSDETATTRAYKLYQKAKAESQAFEDDDAIKDYSASLKLDPTLVFAYIERGDCYSHLNQSQKAKADYLSALNGSLKSNNPHDKPHVGESMRRLQKYYEADKQLDVALKAWQSVVEKTNDPRDFYGKGKCEVAAGHFISAEKDFLKALENDRIFCEVSHDLGKMYVSQKKFANALSVFNRALKKAKNESGGLSSRKNYFLYRDRAECYKAMQNEKMALKDMQEFEHYRDQWFDVVPFQTETSR